MIQVTFGKKGLAFLCDNMKKKEAFENNMNMADVVARYAIMMILVILGVVLQMKIFWILGIYFFLTGILGWDPVYELLGINTKKKKI